MQVGQTVLQNDNTVVQNGLANVQNDETPTHAKMQGVKVKQTDQGPKARDKCIINTRPIFWGMIKLSIQEGWCNSRDHLSHHFHVEAHPCGSAFHTEA
jgi:hypothetical protein